VTRIARYLLDTSAVIDLPKPDELPVDGGFLVSSITVAELNAGVHTADPIKRANRVATLQWLARTVDVLPFTESTAAMYGQLCAMVLAAGRNPRARQMDLLIASVAAVHRLPLVTRNADDFRGLAPLVEIVDLNA
jgi:toxin FitB